MLRLATPPESRRPDRSAPWNTLHPGSTPLGVFAPLRENSALPAAQTIRKVRHSGPRFVVRCVPGANAAAESGRSTAPVGKLVEDCLQRRGELRPLDGHAFAGQGQQETSHPVNGGVVQEPGFLRPGDTPILDIP
jgi:hypothetical protein